VEQGKWRHLDKMLQSLKPQNDLIQKVKRMERRDHPPNNLARVRFGFIGVVRNVIFFNRFIIFSLFSEGKSAFMCYPYVNVTNYNAQLFFSLSALKQVKIETY
jgi:hypothetical protein